MRRATYVAGVAALAIALAAPVWAQGRGRGRGAGAAGRRAGVCIGAGPGSGAGLGRGGWWTRVSPTTPEQQAFVQQVSDIHARIRALNVEIGQLTGNKAPAAEIEKRRLEIAALRAELARVTAGNERLLREMGIPAPYGVCNGQGNGGRGGGAGGWCGGRGTGPRLRDGSGPNPNCPLKKP